MRKIITFTVAALISGSVLAAGEIYRWKDSNGIWHFSDQPHAGAELVRGARPAPAAPAPAAPPAAAPNAAPPPPGLPPVSQETADEVRREAAAIKSEQCKKAEENYQQQMQARRIYRLDAQGNRTYMNEAEMDAARLEARSARDLACGP